MPQFRHIAVASTFSPTFLPLLAETLRLCERFGSKLSIIHASEPDAEKERRFEEALAELGFEEKAPILWSSGDDPVPAIRGALEESGADLLVAGAVERKSEHRHFLGSVARGLIRELQCALFLVPEPSVEPETPQRIVVGYDPSTGNPPPLNQATELGRLFECPDMTLFAIETPFTRSRKTEGDSVEERLLAMAESQAPEFTGEVDTHVIQSNTGFTACDFVQGLESPLLVVGARERDGGRTLPPYMDWLKQVIPCRTIIFSY